MDRLHVLWQAGQYLSMPDILRLAKISRMKDGVPANIQRHYAVPYAYSHRGTLYRGF
jgi:hypothetical protein